MPPDAIQSFWRLNLNAKKVEGARRILSRLSEQVCHELTILLLESSHEGGFDAHMTMIHNTDVTWPETVLEVIEIAQRLGTGWHLSGSIEHTLDLVISQSPSMRITVAGLVWANVTIDKRTSFPA